jgi:POT family proton-dependent oligopeptide transporter
MMGGWFVATAFGNKLSGFLGGIQGLLDPMWFFLLLAGVVTGVALAIRLVVPRMEAALKQYGA